MWDITRGQQPSPTDLSWAPHDQQRSQPRYCQRWGGADKTNLNMEKTAGVEVVYRGRKNALKCWMERLQIFHKKKTATVFDIDFTFLFSHFPASSWATKDASVSVSVQGDHLQGRPSAESWENSWLPWLHVSVHQSVAVLLQGVQRRGWEKGVADGWGESCTVWHTAAIRGGRWGD